MHAQKTILLSILLVITAILCSAQPQFHFDHFSSSNGLSHNSVYSIVQDSVGFTWVATAKGLNRFDGVNFEKFSLEEDYFLSKNIKNLTINSQNVLWAATKSELFNYESCRDKRTNIGFDKDFSAINNIVHTDTHLWAGTDKGLFRLKSDGIFEPVWEIKNQSVNNLKINNSGNLWFTTYKGLYEYDIDKSKLIDKSFYPRDSIYRSISSIAFANDTCWIGTRSGYVFRLKGYENDGTLSLIDSIKLNDEITTILISKNHGVWVGHLAEGISLLNRKTNKLEHRIKNEYERLSSLNHNHILSMFEDKNGKIWIGTYGGGINLYDPNKYFDKQIILRDRYGVRIADDIVWAIWQDPDTSRYLWLGMNDQGVVLYDLIKERVTRRYNLISVQVDTPTFTVTRAVTVLSLCKDANGKLWAGTAENGLQYLDPTEKNQFRLNVLPKALGTSQNGIKSLLALNESRRLLIGTVGNGLFVKDLNSSEAPYKDELLHAKFGDFYCQKLIQDPFEANKVWILTKNQGIIYRDYDSDIALRFMAKKSILSILPDPINKDVVWLSVEEEGIAKLEINNEEFTESYSIVSPLNSLNMIGNPSDSSIWLYGVNTINHFRPYKTDASIFDEYIIAETRFGQELIQGSYFFNGHSPLYLGMSPSGFLKFNWQDSYIEEKFTQKPGFVITEIKSLTSSADSTDLIYNYCQNEIYLPYNKGGIQGNARILNVPHPGQVSYQIIVTNSEGDTIKSSKNNFSGDNFALQFRFQDVIFKSEFTYNLTLLANYQNNPGRPLKKDVAIIISSPWYYSSVSIYLILGTVILLLFLLYLYSAGEKKKVRNLKKEVKESEKTIDEKTKEIESRNKKLQFLHRKISNISRLESIEELSEQAVIDMIELFKFDYAILSLVDPIKRRIELKKQCARTPELVNPELWTDGNDDYGFDLDSDTATDVLAHVCREGEELMVVGNEIIDKDLDFFSLFDAEIYLKHNHFDLRRGFFPILRRKKAHDFIPANVSENQVKEEQQPDQFTLEGADTAIGVFEVGYHKNTGKTFDEESKIDLIHYIENFAQTYYADYLKKEKREIEENLKKSDRRYLVPESYLKHVIEKISREILADCADAFITPLDYGSKWIPTATVEFRLPKHSLRDVYNHIPEVRFGIYKYIIDQKKTYVVKDTLDDPIFISDNLPIRSLVAVPLINNQHVIGGICIYSNKPNQFNFAKQRVVELYAKIVSEELAIKRARKAVDELAKPFNFFDRKSLLKEIGQILEKHFLSHYVSVWLVDEQHLNRFTPSYLNKKIRHQFSEKSLQFPRHFENNTKFRIIEREEIILNFPDWMHTIGSDKVQRILWLPIGKDQTIYGVALIHSLTLRLDKLSRPEQLFLKLFQEKSYQSYTLYRVTYTLISLSQISDNLGLEDFLEQLCSLATSFLKADPVILFVSEPGKSLRYKDGYYAGSFNDERIKKLYEDDDPNSDRKVELANLIVEKGSREFSSLQEVLEFTKITEYKKEAPLFGEKAFWNREGIQFLIAIRLEFQKNSLGAIFFNYRSAESFNEEMKSLVQAFAFLASSAIVSTRKHVKLIRKSEEALLAKERFREAYFVLARGINHDVRGSLHDISKIQIIVEDEIFPHLSEDLENRFRRIFNNINVKVGYVEELISKAENTENLIKLLDSGNKENKIVDVIAVIDENVKNFSTHVDFLADYVDDNQISPKAITFEKVDFNSVPSIVGDQSLFFMVVNNLLSNAVKAIQKKQEFGFIGKIVIRNLSDSKHLIICIEDNGVGISPEINARIYDAYFTDSIGGIGFGLYFSKEVIEKFFEGNLSHQTSFEHWTRFFIQIPVKS